jgi:protease I
MRLFILSLIWATIFAQIPKEKSVLFIIAPRDFRDEEFSIPSKTLKELGYKITVASYDTLPVKGMLGMKVKPDKRIRDISPDEFRALILVGGSGARVFFNDTIIHKLVKGFFQKKKIVSAICISPVTLAKAGILKGKKATVWSDENLIRELKRNGAKYQKGPVIRDGNILTANGPEAAKRFAEELVKMLKE